MFKNIFRCRYVKTLKVCEHGQEETNTGDIIDVKCVLLQQTNHFINPT